MLSPASKLLLLMLVSALTLGACGQKGDLYLPDQNSQQHK
jgi:predicted small lipoprotein YifL